MEVLAAIAFRGDAMTAIFKGTSGSIRIYGPGTIAEPSRFSSEESAQTRLGLEFFENRVSSV